jgi:hypothetical protein
MTACTPHAPRAAGSLCCTCLSTMPACHACALGEWPRMLGRLSDEGHRPVAAHHPCLLALGGGACRLLLQAVTSKGLEEAQQQWTLPRHACLSAPSVHPASCQCHAGSHAVRHAFFVAPSGSTAQVVLRATPGSSACLGAHIAHWLLTGSHSLMQLFACKLAALTAAVGPALA